MSKIEACLQSFIIHKNNQLSLFGPESLEYTFDQQILTFASCEYKNSIVLWVASANEIQIRWQGHSFSCEFAVGDVQQSLAYQCGKYSQMLILTKMQLTKLAFNIETQKMHQHQYFDLQQQMPFSVGSLSVTTLLDFKNNPIFRSVSPQFTWLFTFEERRAVPYQMFESRAWVVCDKIVTELQHKLICDQKVVFNAEEAVFDICENPHDIVILLQQSCVFVDKTFKVKAKIHLSVWATMFVPHGSRVLLHCQLNGLVEIKTGIVQLLYARTDTQTIVMSAVTAVYPVIGVCRHNNKLIVYKPSPVNLLCEQQHHKLFIVAPDRVTTVCLLTNSVEAYSDAPTILSGCIYQTTLVLLVPSMLLVLKPVIEYIPTKDYSQVFALKNRLLLIGRQFTLLDINTKQQDDINEVLQHNTRQTLVRELEPLKLEIESLFKSNDETVQCVTESDVITVASSKAIYAMLDLSVVAELLMPSGFKATVQNGKMVVGSKMVRVVAQFEGDRFDYVIKLE